MDSNGSTPGEDNSRAKSCRSRSTPKLRKRCRLVQLKPFARVALVDNFRGSLDYLIRAREQRPGYVQAKTPGNPQVNHQFVFRGLLDW